MTRQSRKLKLYPSTTRYGKIIEQDYVITEKLDGSNLMFFVLDGELHVSKRSEIASMDYILNHSWGIKGLAGWLREHGEELQAAMQPNSVIIGEWLGMGRLKYPFTQENRFHIFAKANLIFNETKTDETLLNKIISLKSLNYDRDNFIYPFKEQKIPSFMSIVPLVNILPTKPDMNDLNTLYDSYCKQVDRDVEGFVIMDHYGRIEKYIRNKYGYIEDHKTGKINPNEAPKRKKVSNPNYKTTQIPPIASGSRSTAASSSIAYAVPTGIWNL